MNGQKTVLNWSSGKDAAMAYYLMQQQGHNISHLLTTLNDEHDRIFMHGTREQLLELQAQRMGVPLIKVKLPPSPDDRVYRNAMHETLTGLKAEGVDAAAFGDIFLEDLKVYREQQLATVGIQGVFPLWKMNTAELVHTIEAAGIEAILICVNEKVLGKEFLGRKVDAELLRDLPTNVDPCGENGEYHTFVYDAPFFSERIPIKTGEIVHRRYEGNGWDSGFYFLDVFV